MNKFNTNCQLIFILLVLLSMFGSSCNGTLNVTISTTPEADIQVTASTHSDPSMTATAIISSNNVIESNRIQLPIQQRETMINFLHQLAKVEQDAINQLDPEVGANSGLFSEDILNRLANDIAFTRNTEPLGTTYEYSYEQSYYLDMWYDSDAPNTIFINGCEYWRTTRPTSTGEWKLVSQKLEVEVVGNSFKLSNVTIYNNTDFCS